jgi:hypothetical protein
MPGHSPPAPPPPPPPPAQRFLAPVRMYPPRVILNTLMSLAVMVLERRIRQAVRSDAKTGGGHDR